MRGAGAGEGFEARVYFDVMCGVCNGRGARAAPTLLLSRTCERLCILTRCKLRLKSTVQRNQSTSWLDHIIGTPLSLSSHHLNVACGEHRAMYGMLTSSWRHPTGAPWLRHRLPGPAAPLTCAGAAGDAGRHRPSSHVRTPPPRGATERCPFERQRTWCTHTGGGHALAFKQPT